ncbi:sensor histidine kinase [Microvirga massiliensis]|uniref:sensor histidine kinase n=1 Tax=Microvirga massiliensis TaxID=1033741 RepID=UPI00062BBADF|nr:HWE histidine kinase domain-containing protein [Microvirga massiliensis]
MVAIPRPNLSLRARLFILTAVALLPALMILVYNEVSLRRSREAEAHDLALRYGQLAGLEMQGIVSGMEGMLRTIASTPIVRTFDPESCRSFLADIRAQSPHLLTIMVIDREGFIRCGTDESDIGQGLADRPYFRRALETGSFVTGEYTVSRITGRKGLPLATVIKDAKGTVAGVVAASLDLNWLGERIRSRDFARGSALTIADREGVIIAREPFPERFIGTRIPEPYQRLVHAERPGTEEVTSQDGTRRVIGYIPASASPDGLYISAGISLEEAFEAIDRATNRGLALALAGSLVAFVTAWLFAGAFVHRPVSRLVYTIAAWRRGDHSVRTRMSTSHGELESVGAAIDGLMDELATRQAARERAEEQQRMLLNELNHRVKNTLATVQFISARTLRNASSPEEAQGLLESRLAALARAHDVLTRESWEGADVGEIVAQAVAPFSGSGEDRIRFSGPPARVAPRTTLALSMAFQELATNAVKYGALSNRAGTIRITWKLVTDADAGSRLHLRWEEAGGPPVQPPGRRGFGSLLLERVLAQDIDGEVRIEFAATGVVCTLKAQAA